MPTNDFYTYATDGASPNVQSLPSYLGDVIREDGAVAGEAQATTANRAWRQGANMAAALGEAVISLTTLDALDDGDIPTLRDTLIEMFQAAARVIMPPGNTITSITASGNYTVPAGVTKLRVRMVGGGGGAAGGDGTFVGGGGGAGSYLEGVYAVTPGDILAVVVGAGGTGGAASGGGETAGGTSTIVALSLSAPGGSPGVHAAAPSGGDGGTLPSGGDVNIRGGAGTDGAFSGLGAGGNGGASYFGGGGRASTVTSGTVQNGHAWGSGGGGGYGGGSVTGGAGAAGIVIIES